MKRAALSLFVVLSVVVLAAPAAHAAPRDVEITASRTRLSQETERSKKDNLTVKKAEVAYDIEITNKTFNDMDGIEVRYMVFYEVAKAGSTTEPVETFVTGVEQVGDIPSHKKTEITTKPVELKSETLDTGWVWTTGASNKSRDQVVGIWCRVFKDGELLGEYINPSSLERRHDWQDKDPQKK